jgi:transposase-like protein
MELIAPVGITIGDPGETGCLCFKLGDVGGALHFPVWCPDEQEHQRHHVIVRNGHDTGVQGCPQQYLCKTCGRSFYAHTSGFFHALWEDLTGVLRKALAGGRLDLRQLVARFHVTDSAASRLLGAMVDQLARTGAYYRFKHIPREGRAVFVDETWINIASETWYLVLFVNEKGKVLDAVLSPTRKGSIILEHLWRVVNRLRRGLLVLVTDDLSTYKGVAFDLGKDVIHVRHVHKPPYNRIVVDTITWEGNVAHYTTAATASEVVKGTNAFIAMVSYRDRTRCETGRRGRKPGGKNRPKPVIAREKKDREKRGRRKRGPADAFKKGMPNVYYFDGKEGSVAPWGQGDPVVAASFSTLAKVFEKRCITTNPVESSFSTFKKLVNFRGKRTPARMQSITDLFFIIRQERGALAQLMKSLKFNPSFVFANICNLIEVKKPHYRPRRKS